MKVVAIGDNCIDLYEKLNRYYATGNAVNFAVNMKKLGINTAVISTTGNDKYGKIMIDTLKQEGIDLSHFKVKEGATAVSYMDLVGLERTYLRYEQGVMEHVQFSQEDIDFAASCDLVHSAFWGHADKHVKEIHDRGAKTSFDFDTEFKSSLVEKIIPYIDYAFFSFDHRTQDTDNYLRDKVQKGATLAIGTFGEEGSVVFDGKEFHTYGIFPATPVNTIGAGDSFQAGFMNGILKGWPIEKCQEQGAKVSAGVVSIFGPWVD